MASNDSRPVGPHLLYGITITITVTNDRTITTSNVKIPLLVFLSVGINTNVPVLRQRERKRTKQSGFTAISVTVATSIRLLVRRVLERHLSLRILVPVVAQLVPVFIVVVGKEDNVRSAAVVVLERRKILQSHWEHVGNGNGPSGKLVRPRLAATTGAGAAALVQSRRSVAGPGPAVTSITIGIVVGLTVTVVVGIVSIVAITIAVVAIAVAVTIGVGDSARSRTGVIIGVRSIRVRRRIGAITLVGALVRAIARVGTIAPVRALVGTVAVAGIDVLVTTLVTALVTTLVTAFSTTFSTTLANPLTESTKPPPPGSRLSSFKEFGTDIALSSRVVGVVLSQDKDRGPVVLVTVGLAHCGEQRRHQKGVHLKARRRSDHSWIK